MLLKKSFILQLIVKNNNNENYSKNIILINKNCLNGTSSYALEKKKKIQILFNSIL